MTHAGPLRALSSIGEEHGSSTQESDQFGSKEYARTVSKRLSDRWSTTAIEGEIR
jgi:hypothetical protein